MILRIHEKAINNFNKNANNLFIFIEEYKLDPRSKDSFPSQLNTIEILEEDIIGDIVGDNSVIDGYGNTIQRFFYKNNRKFGFSKTNYKKIIKIVEALHKNNMINKTLSYSFIEKVLFEWIKEKYDNESLKLNFIEYLDNQATKNVKSMTLWIPIASLEIEHSFSFANSTISTLSQKMIEDGFHLSEITNQNNQKLLDSCNKIKKNYQGLACVVININAEPDYAFKYAIEESRRITSILGIFSEGILIPNRKCISNIKGSECIAQATVFSKDYKNNSLSIESRLIEDSSKGFWRITKQEISNIKELALDDLSLLLTIEKPNKFQESILTSIFLYSKCAFTDKPIEKIVYLLTSLESILLKNETEPITQNLSERMALFISSKIEERKKIIKIVKSIYSFRSAYLHHGNSSSELEQISFFMEYAQVFFVTLLKNSNNFTTKEAFVSSIDDLKYK